MAELAMLADIQRTVYPEEVTRRLHVMEEARECYATIATIHNHKSLIVVLEVTNSTRNICHVYCMAKYQCIAN